VLMYMDVNILTKHSRSTDNGQISSYGVGWK